MTSTRAIFRLYILCTLAPLWLCCNVACGDERGLVIYVEEIASGLFDRSGKLVADTGSLGVSTRVSSLKQGRAVVSGIGNQPVSDGNSWGYARADGSISRHRYSYARGFADGAAAVRVGGIYDLEGSGPGHPNQDDGDMPDALPHGGKWGYIDPNERYLIGARYDEAQAFSEGLAWVGVAGDVLTASGSMHKSGMLYGCIDRRGDWVIHLGRYFWPAPFREGYAAVWTYTPEGFTFVDRRGVPLTGDRRFVAVGDFSGGLAAVARRVDANKEAWGYINPTGKYAFDARFTRAEPFSEGLAGVRDANGNFGFIDAAGRWIISPRYREVGAFREGLAPVQREGRWGYVDRTGRVAIPCIYDGAASFCEGLARVNVGGKSIPHQSRTLGGRWGFIDHQGHFAVGPAFRAVLDMREGVFAGLKRVRFGLMDRNDVVRVKPIYEHIGECSEGRILFAHNGRYGYLDASGKTVLSPSYFWASDYHGGLAAVEVDAKKGYIDQGGTLVIPPSFDEAGGFYDGLAAVKVGGRAHDDFGAWHYINTEGKRAFSGSFRNARGFSHGFAAVQVDAAGQVTHGPLWKYIQKDGTFAFAGQSFYGAGRFLGGRAYVQTGDGLRILFADGRLVRPEETANCNRLAEPR